MLFFQNYSNLYPPNKTLCAQPKVRNILNFSVFVTNKLEILKLLTSRLNCSTILFSKKIKLLL
ncbi:hypothetical protein [Spiroplasma endosymbiont of Dilophus febrilis]|uniref:hypothetical protein n=1 Tax=Spiroplasma endosymbiont of Dilophus febrilis TaxID=3066292 RepID=UPI00313DA9C8